MPESIYLDWNATTPPHPDVLKAMLEAGEAGWGNPASVHAAGRRARASVEETREALADLLALHPRDVLFTSGGTEANNLALYHAPGLVLSRIEHASVIRVGEALMQAQRPVRWLEVDASGAIAPDAVDAALRDMPEGSVVSVMAANHETGVIQPLPEIGARVHARGAWLHSDAVQGVGKLPPQHLLEADSIAIAAHKMRGPKGVGALCWRRGAGPRPILLGGSQERGLRPGTLDPLALAGFRVAVERARAGPERYQALAPLRDRLEAGLAGQAQVNGSGWRLPHVSNLSFRDQRGDELCAALDLLGVMVSSGSACSAGTTEPSGVISAMLGVERARGALRVSLGETTSGAEIERALALFERALA